MKSNIRWLLSVAIILTVACSMQSEATTDAKDKNSTETKTAAKVAEPAQAAKAVWLTDLEAGKKQAATENKTLFVNFSGSDWCIYCQLLDKEVLTKPAFLDYANKNLVLVNLDFPHQKEQPPAERKRNKELAEAYQIEGFPTVLLLNPQGKEIARTGYLEGGAAKYVKSLEKLVSDAKQSTPAGS